MRGAWAVWAVGLAAYVVAVLQRTSLGVAGLEAADRFGASAGVLASFAVLQLLVYALLQVPVGVALDRIGSRRLIVIGAAVMTAGQVLLGLTTELPLAIGARVLVGAGDALTFLSVLRLVPAWFPPRRVPVLTQLTGVVGQVGQILSAVPLMAVLHAAGWTPAFLGAAAMAVLVAVLALAVVRDAPTGAGSAGDAPTDAGPDAGTPGRRAETVPELRGGLAAAWQHPGTRLGLWAHFVTQFPGTVFGLLWGVPFLVSAQGRSPAEAGLLLSLLVVVGMVAAPVLGVLVGRHPLRRSWLVLGVAGCAAVMWTVVLAWPGRSPLWVLVALVVALGASGPGSMIAFDYARTSNPPQCLGAATGIVNVGGFVGSLVTMLLVGLVLDVVSGAHAAYSLDAFRVALSVQYAAWAVGVAGVVTARRQARLLLAAEGVVVPPIREALRRDRAARRDRPTRRAA